MDVSTRINLPINQLENVKVDLLEESKKISESSGGFIEDSATGINDDAVKLSISSEATDLARLRKKDNPTLDVIDNAKITRFPKLIDTGSYNRAAESMAGPDVKGSFKRIG